MSQLKPEKKKERNKGEKKFLSQQQQRLLVLMLLVVAAVSGLPSLFATLFYCFPKAMRQHQQQQQYQGQQQQPATTATPSDSSNTRLHASNQRFFLCVSSKVKQMASHNSNWQRNGHPLRQLATATSRHSSNIN